ncbi:MAG: hypothetical protein DMF79_08135 [Acidobacteria bacterium]|nr:MAG: hypothetical protein DMF79_08135 [Acidobacteriota bacterium]
MPQKKFSLEAGGPQRLEVSWRGGFKDLSISLDGQSVASFEGPKELKDPQRVSLPDGSTLEVQVASVFVIPELRLTRDGEPIPGSASDPATRHAGAWGMVLAVAILNVAIGLLVELFDVTSMRAIGAGWGSLLSGLVYGVLAFFVRRRSQVALGLAVGLFILDGIFVLVAGAQAARNPPVGSLVARVFFLIPMVRGFAAIRELEQPRRVRRSSPSRPASAPSRPVASAAAAASAAVPARRLTGEAEKRRLQMTERIGTGPAPTVAARGGISIKAQAATDAAASALRFLAHKCEIGGAGLHVTLPSGQGRDVPWADIGRIVVRQLPPDPPWDSGVILDLVAYVGGRWEPVRVFGTTIVNYGALSGGASTSRLDNLRRFARHVRERHPAVAVDDETLGFLESQKAPARFVNMTQFTEYDALYG